MTRPTTSLHTALAAAAALVLAGCASTAAEPDADGQWVLVSGHTSEGEIELVDGHVPEISIDGYAISGTGGCNRIGFVGDEEDLDEWPTEFVSTMMACEPSEVMTQESQFLQALESLEDVAIEDEHLVISGSDSELRFEAAE